MRASLVTIAALTVGLAVPVAAQQSPPAGGKGQMAPTAEQAVNPQLQATEQQVRQATDRLQRLPPGADPAGHRPGHRGGDLARTLRIPLDLEAAVRLAAAGAPQPIDVGEVNGVFFFNVASLGLSVEIARNLTRDMKRRWGALGYAVAAVRVVVRLRPFRAEVEVAGKVDFIRTVQIGVGNGRHFGGGLTADEDATPWDGKLDVFSIEVRGWWELPLLYPALRAGRHGRYRNVHVWDCEALTLRTRRPQPVNTDGEITATTPAHFRVRPRAVRIVCPPFGAQTAQSWDHCIAPLVGRLPLSFRAALSGRGSPSAISSDWMLL